MGYLDRILGKQEPKQQEAAEPEPPAAPSTSSTSTEELIRDYVPTINAQPSSSLYNPYDGISDVLGGRKAVFTLPEGPEFVFAEEAVKRREWGANLSFYTGMGYIGGGSAGAAAGVYRAFKAVPEAAVAESAKLKMNKLLNQSGSLGRSFGNGAAILGLFFSCFESLLFSQADGAVPDDALTVAAGFATAALYRSPRGPRTAAVAGVVGAVGGAGLAGLRKLYPSL